jgi:PAS domain S-box-containing protein
MTFSFQTLALLINIGIALAVAGSMFRRRGTTGAGALIALCLLVALWTAAYIVIDQGDARGFGRAAANAAYVASILSASCGLWIVLVRTNRKRWVTRRNAILFAVLAVSTLALFGAVLTRTAAPRTGFAIELPRLFTTGTWPQVASLYVFAASLASTLLVFDAMVQRRRQLMGTFGLPLLGAALPLIALAVEHGGSNPFERLELLPLAFGLCCVAFLYGLFDRRPEELGAIDRHAAVEGMDEGWIVLDVHDTIMDMNSAAERMTGYSRADVFGQPVSSLLGDLSNLGLSLGESREVELKRSIQLEEGWRSLSIRISTLMDSERTPMGRLTLWRDMTETKQSEDARQRARDEMFVLLNAISSAASNTLSTEDFLLEAIYHFIYPFRSQVVGIFLMEEGSKRRDEGRMQLTSHLGLPEEAIEELAHVPTASPMFHWVMTNRQPMQIADAENDERVPPPVRRIPAASVLMLPLVAQDDGDGKFLGCMMLARKELPAFSQDEIERLTTISDHMASLIDSDRRRKLAIALRERERLMRDLHDSVSQKLYGLVTTTEAAQAAMEAGSNVDPRQEFARIGEHARQAVKEMRLFLYQMQQVDVEKDGLISVLHHRLLAVEGRADIKARLLSDEEDIPLATDAQMMLYYIAQEALNNVLRHAHATSVLVTLKRGRGTIVLEILDDGVGFDARKVDRSGLGLRNMRERVSQLDGKLQVISKPGVGTRIVVAVPMETGDKSLNRGRQE